MEQARVAGLSTAEDPSQENMMPSDRSATLYRMILPDHTCPYGVRAKELLEQAGFAVDDRILHSRDEVEAFKAEHGVPTTPLIFIDGECVGGCSDLERYLVESGAA
jgi:glutaredoxin